MVSQLAAARGALKLGFFVSSLTLASLGARFATANVSPGAAARNFGVATARAVNGDLSNRSLKNTFNAANDPLFARHDPGVKAQVAADLLSGYEQGEPLFHGDLTSQQAQAVNASVPMTDGPNPAARPFVFRGSSADRRAALTCLTQAVYYEAGSEPIQGAQAVAQVVLNRVRHPIFPSSVCGVVYQGAGLKTGCQFSFVCDGALNRTPAPAAWDRARQVADRALNGFVMKEVGEATHYHTDQIVPWWAPTVSKVANVGTQIFYRWRGALGMPAAFVGRYAGGEHVGGADQAKAPELAAVSNSRASDGRLHVILQAAASTTLSPGPATVAASRPEMPGNPVALAQLTNNSSSGTPASPHPAQ
jgi:spore germination cell wall hydrolase CwlJ-like protein